MARRDKALDTAACGAHAMLEIPDCLNARFHPFSASRWSSWTKSSSPRVGEPTLYKSPLPINTAPMTAMIVSFRSQMTPRAGRVVPGAVLGLAHTVAKASAVASGKPFDLLKKLLSRCLCSLLCWDPLQNCLLLLWLPSCCGRCP